MLYNQFQGLVATGSSWVWIWNTTEFSGLGLDVKGEVSQRFHKEVWTQSRMNVDGRSWEGTLPMFLCVGVTSWCCGKTPWSKATQGRKGLGGLIVLEVGSIMVEKGADRFPSQLYQGSSECRLETGESNNIVKPTPWSNKAAFPTCYRSSPNRATNWRPST